MIPNMNSRQVQQMMRKMGIQQDEVEASRVVIETPTGNIIIANPQVTKVNMSGQETFQITGDIQEEDITIEVTQEDIQTVMDQANVDEETAIKAIEEAEGDLAQAILTLHGN